MRQIKAAELIHFAVLNPDGLATERVRAEFDASGRTDADLVAEARAMIARLEASGAMNDEPQHERRVAEALA